MGGRLERRAFWHLRQREVCLRDAAKQFSASSHYAFHFTDEEN